jgi:hypothetical protein
MKEHKQPAGATSSSLTMNNVVTPSPNWSFAMPSGPDRRVKITKEYAKRVGRDTSFWAWPLVNIYNRRLAAEKSKELAYAGPVPTAPLNRIVMLTDYVVRDERIGACPNQDVVYGVGSLGLEKSPMVIQVPDFGDRFWVYQAVDLRSDGFVQIGKMYGSTPGFYLLIGPNYCGEIPQGITQVFRASTNTGFIAPRIFMDDTDEDRRSIQPLLQQIMMYPLAEYDGRMKSTDWNMIPKLPNPWTGEQEVIWVPPQSFVDTLPAVLADAPPLPGEEARYTQVLAVLDAAKNDPQLKEAMTEGAIESNEELVKPLFQFRNYGQQLPYNWSTISNEAAFGTDYFTRTAVAKSNIFVNSPKETKYFYQDLDEDGLRLNGSSCYAITFAKEQTPPVYGFWSLTLYNEYHFFVPNKINRYSVGTKNKDLKTNADGSLTICVRAESPSMDQRPNWLQAPKNADFTLYCRAYWPRAEVIDGSWTPPPVERKDR